MYIWHVMFWEFKNNKNAKEIPSVYGQGVISDHQVRNWFSKYCFSNTPLRDKPSLGWSSDLNLDALKRIGRMQSTKSTQELAQK